MRTILTASLIASLFVFITIVPSAVAEDADIIFIGDNIITVDPEAPRKVEAVAVAGNEIIAVGSKRKVMRGKANRTRIVELGDHALLPGFIDAHGHMSGVATFLSLVNLSSPPVGVVEDIDDIVSILSKRIETEKITPGEWVYGYGYDDSLIAENRHPNRDDLDRASTEHPIVLMHVSGHLAAVNSAALNQVGISNLSPDPPGGVIRRRDDSPEPNGVMEETAVYPFRAAMQTMLTPALVKRLLREAVLLHASYGITTIQEGGTQAMQAGLYRQAAEEDPFDVDIVAYLFGNALSTDELAAIEHSDEYRGGFRIGGVKMMLDGSPQGRTAYLSKPYDEGPPGARPDYVAYPVLSAEKYNSAIATLIEHGVPVLAHANGDGAIDMMIAGVEAALDGVDKIPDHRSVIIHAQLMREDQLHKVKQFGLLPSCYAAHPFFWGDWHRKSFGEARAAFISPSARTAELGIPFTIHNDSPVVPPDIMRLLWIAVNRETRSGFVLGEDQRLTPMQAIHAVTLGAAYQYFEEDIKGSITRGKQADLVVLDRNPLTVDPSEIKDIKVLETFARGRSIYSRNTGEQ